MASPAFAQQQPDPAFLAEALTSVQQQRNQALDMHASTEARGALLKDEVAKLKVRETGKTSVPKP